MTKQQPCALGAKASSKSMPFSMAHICRVLLMLGAVKLSLLFAMSIGYPLPEISLFSPSSSEVEQEMAAAPALSPEDEKNQKAAQDAQTATKLQNLMAANSIAEPVKQEAPKAEKTEIREPKAKESIAPQGQTQAFPQGSDAIRALANLTKKNQPKANAVVSQPTAKAVHAVQASQANTHMVAPKKPEQKSPWWWNGLASIKNLPIPLLGVDQVAYAATLESPPNPVLNPSGTTSPFSPPEQVLPAGVAGPQVGIVPQDPLVPNPNPPSPNVNAYVPAEDPQRKQEELARREQEILMLQRQVEQRLQELQAAEKKVQEMLKEAKSVEQQKVDGLTSMYVNMKPKQAALALENMEERTAVKILSSMKAKQAGEIFSYMNPQKTAKLTELISRMRLGQ